MKRYLLLNLLHLIGTEYWRSPVDLSQPARTAGSTRKVHPAIADG